jgi:hypothetical protein
LFCVGCVSEWCPRGSCVGLGGVLLEGGQFKKKKAPPGDAFSLGLGALEGAQSSAPEAVPWMRYKL